MRPSSFMKTSRASFRKSDDPSREFVVEVAKPFVAVTEIRASSFLKFNNGKFISDGKFNSRTIIRVT